MKPLIKRTLVGVAYLLVMISCILLSRYTFLALFVFVTLKVMEEFLDMNIGKGGSPERLCAYITSVALFVLYFCHKSNGLDLRYSALAFIPFFAMMICALPESKDFKKTSFLYTSILYIAVPFTMMSALVFKDAGEYDGVLLLCLFVLIWISDTGAYVFGMLLGQKYGPKLCPSISPHKSWIGAIGGLLFTIGAAIALNYITSLDFGIVHWIALAIIVDVAGIMGDLFESKWKRANELKDSGNFLPGHGGLFDRFDSAMMALPAAVVYLFIFNLI